VTDRADSRATSQTIRIDVLRGSPTSSDLAALIAVVPEAYREESSAATAEDAPGRSAWSLSQRSLRQPLRRDVGWGGFSG
jgi:hypothetical protein